MMTSASSDSSAVLDLARWPTAEQFVTRCCEFLEVIKDLSVPPCPLFPGLPWGWEEPASRPAHGVLTGSHGHRTPGKELEARLNRDFGPGNDFYEDFCKYMRQGLREGWVAST